MPNTNPLRLFDFADNVVDNAKIFDQLIDALANPGEPNPATVDTQLHACKVHQLILGDAVTTSAGGVAITPDDQDFGLNHFEIGLGPANSVRLVQFLRTLPPEPEEGETPHFPQMPEGPSRSWDTYDHPPREAIGSIPGSYRWFVRFYVPDNEAGTPVKLPAPCQWWRAGYALKHTIVVAIVRSQSQAVPWIKLDAWWPGLKPDRSHMIGEDWEPGDFSTRPPSDDTYREIVL